MVIKYVIREEKVTESDGKKTVIAHLPDVATLPNEHDAMGKKWVEYSLPYVLLFKVRKNYSIVDATHPGAVKYMEVANGLKDGPKDGHPEDGQRDGSRKNSSFRTKSLFFGAYSHSITSRSHSLNTTPKSPKTRFLRTC